MEDSNKISQPQQPVSPTPAFDNNSGKSKVIPIILGIAAAMVITIGAYILGTKQSQPVAQNTVQTTPIPSPVHETAGWKLKSTEFFSFKYPSDWQEQPDENKTTGGFFAFSPIDSSNTMGLIVSEYTYINPLETPSQLAKQALGKNEIPLNRKNIMVDGHESVYQDRQEIDSMGKSVRRIEVYIGDVKSITNFRPEDGGPRLTNGTLMAIMTIYDESMVETGGETLNQILSTFKFTQ